MSLSYVMMTAARNEEAFIEKTIRSITAQTSIPKKWIIVSDASNDRTDAIVTEYAQEYRWIELLRMPVDRPRDFAAKVGCLQDAWKKLSTLEFDLIANLDADITVEPDYYEFLLDKFRNDGKLGVAGTRFVEDSGFTYDYKFVNIEHVSGGAQVFRRACFEAVGGYSPLKYGGEDWLAVTTARMLGWKTRTFPEKAFFHHRSMGTGSSGKIKAQFRFGFRDYLSGGHPLWEVFRGINQIRSKPYLIGSTALFSGFIWGYISRKKRVVSPELKAFFRKEQLSRLYKFFRS